MGSVLRDVAASAVLRLPAANQQLLPLSTTMLIDDINLTVHVLIDILHAGIHQRLVATLFHGPSVLCAETLIQELLRILRAFLLFLLFLLLFAT